MLGAPVDLWLIQAARLVRLRGSRSRRSAETTLDQLVDGPPEDDLSDDEGLDPVDNIVGYSHACRGTFTPGQIKRMKFLWRTARGGKGDDLVTPDNSVPSEDSEGGCNTGHASGAGLLFAFAALLRSVNRRGRRAL